MKTSCAHAWRCKIYKDTFQSIQQPAKLFSSHFRRLAHVAKIVMSDNCFLELTPPPAACVRKSGAICRVYRVQLYSHYVTCATSTRPSFLTMPLLPRNDAQTSGVWEKLQFPFIFAEIWNGTCDICVLATCKKQRFFPVPLESFLCRATATIHARVGIAQWISRTKVQFPKFLCALHYVYEQILLRLRRVHIICSVFHTSFWRWRKCKRPKLDATALICQPKHSYPDRRQGP